MKSKKNYDFVDSRCVVFRIDQEEFSILYQTPVCVIQHDALCSIKLTTNVLFFQDILKKTFLPRNGSFTFFNFKTCFRNKNSHKLISILQLDLTKLEDESKGKTKKFEELEQDWNKPGCGLNRHLIGKNKVFNLGGSHSRAV